MESFLLSFLLLSLVFSNAQAMSTGPGSPSKAPRSIPLTNAGKARRVLFDTPSQAQVPKENSADFSVLQKRFKILFCGSEFVTPRRDELEVRAFLNSVPVEWRHKLLNDDFEGIYESCTPLQTAVVGRSIPLFVTLVEFGAHEINHSFEAIFAIDTARFAVDSKERIERACFYGLMAMLRLSRETLQTAIDASIPDVAIRHDCAILACKKALTNKDMAAALAVAIGKEIQNLHPSTWGPTLCINPILKTLSPDDLGQGRKEVLRPAITSAAAIKLDRSSQTTPTLEIAKPLPKSEASCSKQDNASYTRDSEDSGDEGENDGDESDCPASDE